MFYLILVNVFWMLYLTFEGFREGFYNHFKNNSKKSFNFEINPFFIQKIIVFILSSYILYNTYGISSIAPILSLLMFISFFYSGSYYYTRNKLDDRLYTLRWKSKSTSSNKIIKFLNYRNRSILMIIGVIIESIFVIIKK